MILLVGNYPVDRQESMLRFAALLREKLRDHGTEVELIAPQPVFGRLMPSSTGLGKWLGYLDKFLLFPIHLRRRLKKIRNPVLVHLCDQSSAHYTRYLQGVPHLVTCHDVLALRSARGDFPENGTRWSGRFYQRLIREGLRSAAWIVCVSEATRSQWRDFADDSDTQVRVIENGLNHPYHALAPAEAMRRVGAVLAAQGKAFSPACPFILHVGGNHWYKNRAGVLAIYQKLRKQVEDAPWLFLVGEKLTDSLWSQVDSQNRAFVLEFGNLNNEELEAFYSAARVLLFPSTHEGFGWPIIEAQACGCPVATTDRAPMNQIGGSAAVYFDPADAVSAAAEVQRLLQETFEARAHRVAAGMQNAARFSTERMINAYLALYAEIMAQWSPPASGDRGTSDPKIVVTSGA